MEELLKNTSINTLNFSDIDLNDQEVKLVSQTILLKKDLITSFTFHGTYLGPYESKGFKYLIDSLKRINIKFLEFKGCNYGIDYLSDEFGKIKTNIEKISLKSNFFIY
jgi:hypothetical protein